MPRPCTPEMAERQPSAPQMADPGENGREMVRPRQPRADVRIYQDLPGARNIGRKPLVLGVLYNALQPPLAPQAPQNPQAPLLPTKTSVLHSTMSTMELHRDLDYRLDWAHLFNTAWLSWMRSRVKMEKGWTISYTKLRSSLLSMRGTLWK